MRRRDQVLLPPEQYSMAAVTSCCRLRMENPPHSSLPPRTGPSPDGTEDPRLCLQSTITITARQTEQSIRVRPPRISTENDSCTLRTFARGGWKCTIRISIV